MKGFIVAIFLLVYLELGDSLFEEANNLVGGGITGLGSIIQYSTGFNVAYSYVIINTILVLIAMKVLGGGFGAKTIYALLVTGLFFLAFVLKRRRSVMLFLALVYTGNIFIYSFTLAYQSYGQTLTHIWYIMLGIGLPLLIEAGKRAVRACKTFQR